MRSARHTRPHGHPAWLPEKPDISLTAFFRNLISVLPFLLDRQPLQLMVSYHRSVTWPSIPPLYSKTVEFPRIPSPASPCRWPRSGLSPRHARSLPPRNCQADSFPSSSKTGVKDYAGAGQKARALHSRPVPADDSCSLPDSEGPAHYILSSHGWYARFRGSEALPLLPPHFAPAPQSPGFSRCFRFPCSHKAAVLLCQQRLRVGQIAALQRRVHIDP